MGRTVLSRSGADGRVPERGFTLIEVMIAMAITITVMLANLALFNTAQRNLALGRSLTEATNLATRKIGDFRAMTMAQIEAAAPTVAPSPNPLNVREGSDTVDVDGVLFTRTWVVSQVDLEHAAPPVGDLAGDVVKINLNVSWRLANRDHQVTMATFATGSGE